VLTEKDCENVYELVYSSHRGVAQAAGEFLNAKLFVHDIDEATRNLRTQKGKKRSENTSRIRDLILFFIESEVGMNCNVNSDKAKVTEFVFQDNWLLIAAVVI